jgi:hypothetical protein
LCNLVRLSPSAKKTQEEQQQSITIIALTKQTTIKKGMLAVAGSEFAGVC